MMNSPDIAMRGSTSQPTTKVYVMVWIGLLVIVGVEVALTYSHLSSATLLAALLGLATVEAGLGLTYFMHLRYERSALVLALVPGLVFVFVMMNHFWPDALRLRSLHP